MAADGSGYLARFGHRRGSRGARDVMSPALVSAGRRCHPKPVANRVSASAHGSIILTTSDPTTTLLLTSATSAANHTSDAAASTNIRGTLPSSTKPPTLPTSPTTVLAPIPADPIKIGRAHV